MRIERFSHSKYSTADLCGQLFYHRYVARDDLTPSASMLRGGGPHTAAEANYTSVMKTGEPLQLDIIKDIAATATRRSVRARGVRVDGAYEGTPLRHLTSLLVDEAVALAAEYREKIAPHVDPAGIELKIEIPPSEIWPFTSVSVLDVVTQDGWIRDTKTKRKAPAGTTADDSDQLTWYELAYQAKYGRPSAGQKLDFLWRTPARKEVKSVTQSTSRDTHQLARLAIEVQRTHKALEAEIFIPAKATDWICSKSWCEAWNICPVVNAGKKRVTS